MILPPSYVSTTGDVCNLVGTSFSAFENQPVRLMPVEGFRAASSFELRSPKPALDAISENQSISGPHTQPHRRAQAPMGLRHHPR